MQVMKAKVMKSKKVKKVVKKKPKTPAWLKSWEKKYQRQLKSGRFIKEDGICYIKP